MKVPFHGSIGVLEGLRLWHLGLRFTQSGHNHPCQAPDELKCRHCLKQGATCAGGPSQHLSCRKTEARAAEIPASQSVRVAIMSGEKPVEACGSVCANSKLVIKCCSNASAPAV